MKPLAAADAETPTSLASRLERLSEALHELPEWGRRSTDHPASRILLSIDDIIVRVRALTGFLEEDGGRPAWDLVDHTAAQMLLRDLAIIARDLRVVAASVATDLTSAEDNVRSVLATIAKIEAQAAQLDLASPAATPDAT